MNNKYLITLSVNGSLKDQEGVFPIVEDGKMFGYGYVVKVFAENQKEAWQKVNELEIGLVIKIEEQSVKEVKTNTKKSKYNSFDKKWTSLCQDSELVLNRHKFVLTAIALLTTRKANRDYVNGYQVIKSRGNKWRITFNGVTTVIGDASTIYGWCVRTPLNRLVSESEILRSNVYDSIHQ